MITLRDFGSALAAIENFRLAEENDEARELRGVLAIDVITYVRKIIHALERTTRDEFFAATAPLRTIEEAMSETTLDSAREYMLKALGELSIPIAEVCCDIIDPVASVEVASIPDSTIGSLHDAIF
jgi:hypothetical protein